MTVMATQQDALSEHIKSSFSDLDIAKGCFGFQMFSFPCDKNEPQSPILSRASQAPCPVFYHALHVVLVPLPAKHYVLCPEETTPGLSPPSQLQAAEKDARAKGSSGEDSS